MRPDTKNRNEKTQAGLVALFVAAFLLQASAARANPSRQWVTDFDGPLSDNDYAGDIVADDQGNTYVTGSASRPGAFAYGDVVTLKIDHLGAIVWRRYHDHLGWDDEGSRIAIDRFGNIVVVGTGGDGPYGDILVLKYDPAGNLVCKDFYNKLVGGISTPDRPWDMALDQDANILIAGQTGGYGTNPDYITLKYNADCVREWENRFDGVAHGYDIARGIAVDSGGAVIVTGMSDFGLGTSDFKYLTMKLDPNNGAVVWQVPHDGTNGWGSATDVAVDDLDDIYVTGGSGSDYVSVKYDAAGNLLWDERYDLNPGPQIKEEASMMIDDAGNVYVAGGSGPDFATFMYSTSGQLMWHDVYDGPSGGPDYAADIVIDENRNAYVTGSGSGTSSFDYLTMMYDGGGGRLWSPPPLYDSPDRLGDQAAAVAVDCEGSVFVVGTSQRMATKTDVTIVKYVQAVGFRRGDANCDGKNDIADTLLIWDIVNGKSTNCQDAADTNDDGEITFDDVAFSLWHVSFGGPAPAAPYPGLGHDPTPDCLVCRMQCSP